MTIRANTRHLPVALIDIITRSYKNDPDATISDLRSLSREFPDKKLLDTQALSTHLLVDKDLNDNVGSNSRSAAAPSKTANPKRRAKGGAAKPAKGSTRAAGVRSKR